MANAALGPVARIINATRYSLNGLGDAWRTQAPLRYECFILIVLIPLAYGLGKSGTERALLIGSWLLVIVVELINSAIETIVDRIGSEHHELSGRAKDLGSAAVFCAIVLAASVWLLLCLG
jgi:diacylglycerol kinase (ATP)